MPAVLTALQADPPLIRLDKNDAVRGFLPLCSNCLTERSPDGHCRRSARGTLSNRAMSRPSFTRSLSDIGIGPGFRHSILP